MFGRRRQEAGETPPGRADRVAVAIEPRLARSKGLASRVDEALAPRRTTLIGEQMPRLDDVQAVFALYPDAEMLDRLSAAVRAERERRDDGWPVLVVALTPDALTDFGVWMAKTAPTGNIHGLRLLVERDWQTALTLLTRYLEPVYETNVIAMPVSTEVETDRYKYFFCLSPQLRGLLGVLAELAENNIERIYLLGGPGAGKTSLAYFYYLCRAKGNFVTVNLAAEATGDKAAIKSMLCGHVPGAFPGAGSRTGAFSHARDGVCFLDESHGVMGSVMEVLMEALDSGQYLPYGASAKRPLDCGLVFASNRSWEKLMSSINIDEHARLAAQVLHMPDLAQRREDLIAVLSVTLAGLAQRSRTWQAPSGLTHAAWQTVCDCPWRGNTRALMRVIETAYVTAATLRSPLIERDAIEEAIAMWEPSSHDSHRLYGSGVG